MSAERDDDLDMLFADMRASAPEPGPGLLARVLQDATDMQPQPAAIAPSAAPPRRISFWQQVMDQLGGWPAVAGLASCVVLGAWIGINPPTQIAPSVASLVGGTELTDILGSGGSFDFSNFEG